MGTGRIAVPANIPPELIKYIEESLRGNRSLILGPNVDGQIEVFQIRSRPQELAAAVGFSAGFEVEEEKVFEAEDTIEHEINIELH